VYAAIRATNQSTSRILAFCSCGTGSHVYRTVEPPYEYRIGGSCCHDRFCLPCSQTRSAVIAENIYQQLGRDPVRFLTLTLRATDGSLSEQIDRIYTSFSALRKSTPWHKHVIGGCAMLETSWSPASESWHVHLHCLVHGSYYPHDELKAGWYRVTGDSYVVDVRLVKDHRTIARYVSKYISKPVDRETMHTTELIEELIVAYRGRRTCMTFGDWRGVKLTERQTDREWESLGTLDDIVASVVNGDVDAERILENVCGGRTDDVIASYRRRNRPPPIHITSNGSTTRLLFQPRNPCF